MSASLDNRVALVTGATRGIGRAIAEKFAAEGAQVLVGCRDLDAGKEVADALGHRARAELVDLKSPRSIAALAERVGQDPGRLDILVNNAGVMLDGDTPPSGLDPEVLQETLQVNLVGAALLTQGLLPLLRRTDWGRILNISSGWGSMTEILGLDEVTAPAYRISKAALNAYTAMLSRELAGTDILALAMCPGWVRTEMGGEEATRTPEQAALGALALVLLDGAPAGRLFRDAEEISF